MTRLRVYDETRALFHLPAGIIYLDGNSLGALPNGVAERVARVIAAEWGDELIRAWNSAGWTCSRARVGDRIAKLIGAAAGSVMVGDTLSLKVYQALAAALEMTPQRKVILSDRGNFPTDLYMARRADRDAVARPSPAAGGAGGGRGLADRREVAVLI